MENKSVNLDIVARVAIGLKELKEEMIFVGGATVSLYATDPAADIARPTDDIDLTISSSSFSERVALNERLAELGFHADPEGNNICRYRYEGIAVDIMPMEDSEIGPSNPWYEAGSDDIRIVEYQGQELQILPPAAFLATKFQAFINRGHDYRTSHDFEDIIYVIDNNLEIVTEVRDANEDIRDFLRVELDKVMSDSNRTEIISSQLHPAHIAGRLETIVERISQILDD